jgi:hypothetical protein
VGSVAKGPFCGSIRKFWDQKINDLRVQTFLVSVVCASACGGVLTRARASLPPTVKGHPMAWYQVINAHPDPYVADRAAEALFRQFAAALRAAHVAVTPEVYYGRTPTGARIYYISLSPQAFAMGADVLEGSEVTVLPEPPDLRGTEPLRSL